MAEWVITKFLLAMYYYYSSLTRAFCQHNPSSTLLPGHGCAFPCCNFYNTTTITTMTVLSWRSFLQETQSTPRNFLMYCLVGGHRLYYTHESRGILLCLLSRASLVCFLGIFWCRNFGEEPKWLSIHKKIQPNFEIFKKNPAAPVVLFKFK